MTDRELGRIGWVGIVAMLIAFLLVLCEPGCVTTVRVPVRVTASGEPFDVVEGCREVCLTHCEGSICTNTGLDVKIAIVFPDRRVGCVCQPFTL